MLSFTKQERMVVFCLMAIIAMGSSLKIVFIKYPHLKDIVNLIEGEKLYYKIDINKASFDDLVDIPFIGEYTANNILEYKKENGEFSSLLQLKKVKGIRDKNYEKFIRYLKVQGE